MTKSEFISVLLYKLGNIDAEAKKEILNDFNEHFDIGLSSGMSEEDICRQLGDPEEISQQYLDDYAFQRGASSHRSSSHSKNFSDDLQDLQEVIHIIKDFKDYKSKNNYRHEQCHEPRREHRHDQYSGQYRDSSVNSEIGENDYIFDSDQGSCSFDDVINYLKISGDNLDLNIEKTESNSVCFELENNSRYRYIVRRINDQVLFERLDKRPFFNFFSSSKIKLTVKIPERGLIHSDILLGGGDVEICGLSSDMDIRSGSGDIALTDCRHSSVDKSRSYISINTGSGDIDINRITGRLNLKSGSGDISYKTEENLYEASMLSGSGDLQVKCTSLGILNLKTGSGDVEIKCHSVAEISAKTGSGDIDIDLHESMREIVATTGTGEVEIKCNKISGDLRAQSASGDVCVYTNEILGYSVVSATSGEVKMHVNKISRDFELSSVSGSINAAFSDGCDIELLINSKTGSVKNEFQYNPQKASYGKCRGKIKTVTGNIKIKNLLVQ